MANRYLKYKCTFFTELVVTLPIFLINCCTCVKGQIANKRKISCLFPISFFKQNSSRFMAREHI